MLPPAKEPPTVTILLWPSSWNLHCKPAVFLTPVALTVTVTAEVATYVLGVTDEMLPGAAKGEDADSTRYTKARGRDGAPAALVTCTGTAWRPVAVVLGGAMLRLKNALLPTSWRPVTEMPLTDGALAPKRTAEAGTLPDMLAMREADPLGPPA